MEHSDQITHTSIEQLDGIHPTTGEHQSPVDTTRYIDLPIWWTYPIPYCNESARNLQRSIPAGLLVPSVKTINIRHVQHNYTCMYLMLYIRRSNGTSPDPVMDMCDLWNENRSTGIIGRSGYSRRSFTVTPVSYTHLTLPTICSV